LRGSECPELEPGPYEAPRASQGLPSGERPSSEPAPRRQQPRPRGREIAIVDVSCVGLAGNGGVNFTPPPSRGPRATTATSWRRQPEPARSRADAESRAEEVRWREIELLTFHPPRSEERLAGPQRAAGGRRRADPVGGVGRREGWQELAGVYLTSPRSREAPGRPPLRAHPTTGREKGAPLQTRWVCGAVLRTRRADPCRCLRRHARVRTLTRPAPRLVRGRAAPFNPHGRPWRHGTSPAPRPGACAPCAPPRPSLGPRRAEERPGGWQWLGKDARRWAVPCHGHGRGARRAWGASCGLKPCPRPPGAACGKA
jgi:hypothetical protein